VAGVAERLEIHSIGQNPEGVLAALWRVRLPSGNAT
jgi:hypothetical protein